MKDMKNENIRNIKLFLKLGVLIVSRKCKPFKNHDVEELLINLPKNKSTINESLNKILLAGENSMP